MVRTPGSTAIAVVILAIGVGGNATIYTMAETLLVSPPPLVSEPRELVGLDGGTGGGRVAEFGYYDFEFFRENSEALQDVLAYGGFPGTRGRTARNGGEVSVGDGDARVQAQAWVVSSNYFQVLGVSPLIGSGFTGEVGLPAAGGPEVMLSHGFWKRSFGGDPSVLDHSFSLNGMPFRVVGITPAEFRGVNPADRLPDLFIPIRSAGTISAGFDEALRRFDDDGGANASRFLRLVARLAPGVDLGESQAEMAVLQGQWAAEFGAWSEEVYGGAYRFNVRSEYNLSPYEASQFRRIFTFLWFVVGAVFLIACTNLALLLLAKAAGREREMGIRTAMGAGRARLFKQLLTESLALALIGGVLGIGIAYVAVDAVAATLPFTVGVQFRPDAMVVAFSVLLSSLAAVLFGTAPAWMLSRLNLLEALQRPGQGRAKVLFRGGLVAVQTALSIVLLIVCGLFGRSFQAARDVDLGFTRENRLLLSVQLDNQGLPDAEGIEITTQVMDRLAAVPGVAGVSTANRIPFLGSNIGPVTAPGTEYAESGMRSGLNLVGPGYFDVMEIPLVSGRGFSRDDRLSSQRVAVVNQVFAERMWPGTSPLGRTVGIAGDEWLVVGVAKTAIYYSLAEQPRAHVYFPQLQLYMGRMTFVVAKHDEPLAIAGAVEGALREVNPDIAIAFLTMDQLVDEQLASFRVWAVFVSVFSGIALLLTMVGLYGVQSFLVSRRTREIGIRMALGAEAPSVVGDVVRGSLFMGGIGTVLGVGAALAAADLLRGLLFGVSPNDPLVFVVVPFLLILSCVVATLGPACRASRISPLEALSQE
jgi:predicted permease